MTNVLSFGHEDRCSPSRSGDKTCYIFQWIGQSFESCENCGKPYWEQHLFDPTYGGTKGLYRIKVYVKYLDFWEWKRVNPITKEKREATRKKWEGYYDWAVEQNQKRSW